MHVRTEDLPNATRILRVDGHLDEQSQVNVADVIRRSLDEGISRLILDLDGVVYLTSAGFATLLALYGRARAMGGDVVVMNAPPHVEAMFRVLNMADVCLAADLEQAIERFSDIQRESTRTGPPPPSALDADDMPGDSSGLLPNV